jgi:VacB/RNase II family 3'-5' exoribonuclease
MVERGLLPDFSHAAVAQANAITKPVTDGEGKARDLRDLVWASIDNDDSRDLDQISVAEPGDKDRVKILVAIADVNATVEQGSPIDDHARTNTTSVYTAAQVFPMLPEKLSTDLTSLGQGQDRLAMVVEMLVDKGGKVLDSDIYRAKVKNQAKLAYDSVAAWLEGTAPVPPRIDAVPGLADNLRIQDRAARSMRALRSARGSLRLASSEARAIFDGEMLAELRPDERNRAKDLIEDLMIAANGVAAEYLEKARVPSLRRVLRNPERWDRIVEIAQSHDTRLPKEPDARALSDFLLARRDADPKSFPDLSLSIIKLLGRGEYVLENPGQIAPGHFGLAVSDYTHSTAPNRRFPDVIEQRLLKAALFKQPMPYSPPDLDKLAKHCTEQEGNAQKVERQIRKSAAALLLEHRVGEQFDAVVTGASDKGTWVRTLHPHAEGKVVRGAKGLDVGDSTRVELLAVDVDRGFLDFGRAKRS